MAVCVGLSLRISFFQFRGDASRFSSSDLNCQLICPYSKWKLTLAKKLLANDKITASP